MPKAIVREAVEKINGGFPDLVRIHLGKRRLGVDPRYRGGFQHGPERL